MSIVQLAPTALPARVFSRMNRQQLFVLSTIGPLSLFMLAFYALPLALMLSRGVSEPTWTLANFERLFSNPIYVNSFWITTKISFFVTLICLVLSVPVAYAFRQLSRGTVNILMILVLLPLWTSVLVRSFAWVVILGRNGLINQGLLALGVIDAPLRMLNTTFAVYLAMAHIMLPYMILPVYSVVKGIDETLIRAALGMGARPFAVFTQVVLPLAMPGIMAGCLLVFILCLGMFITPALVGSPADLVVSMLIQQQVDLSNWPFASALAGALLILTLLMVFVGARLLGANRVVAGFTR